MAFTIKIQPEVRSDIQEGVDWYNEQQNGLGTQFFTSVQVHLNKLKSNPFYQVRYDDVRCMPLKKFPYMIHYTVEENLKQITVHGILSTHRNPSIWRDRI